MCPLFSAQVLNGTPSVSEQLLNGGQLSGRLVCGVEREGESLCRMWRCGLC